MHKRILVLTLLLLAVPCRAEIIIVDDDGSADFNNIQAAIDYSSDWDTIYVLPGIYTGPGNREIDFLGKAITVQSVIPEDPYIVAATIIDCDANASDTHRGFTFHEAEDGNSVLAGFTIMNGYTYSGGGIYCYHSSPTITNCVIKDNTADDGGGGGIYCYGSSPAITSCVISYNQATYSSGGGIFCFESYPTISNCVISYNETYSSGGGIYCDYYDYEVISGTLNINNSTFTNNSAQGDGGAIDNSSGPIINCTFMWNTAGDDGGALSDCQGPITNCTFTNNSAGGIQPFSENCGGALYRCSGTIANCIISDNTADEYGGGIYNYYGWGLQSITNCTITGNWARFDGGGLYNEYGRPTITNCIISGNTTSKYDGYYGGGIYCYGGSLRIANCTFTGNWAASAGCGVFNDWGYIVISNCILWGNTPEEIVNYGITDVSCSDVQGGYPGIGNLNIDPCFVEAGYWADANDPNVPLDPYDPNAVWVEGDYHLRRTSPCIDAGCPFMSIEPNAVDIDNQPRVMGFIVDMGADEFPLQIIVVTKPEGGEVWISGSSHEIAWDSDLYEGAVDISFSEDGGSNWETVESNLPDAGSYLWHLPDIVDSNQCLISVEPNVPDPNVLCINSGLFTIHPDFLHPEVPSKWKSLGGDFKRAGLSENYGPQLGCVKWQFETEAAVSASITIGAGDRVHIACEDGKVYTLDIDDGSLLWSYDTNSPLLSAPTVGPRGSVYVGSENGKLYAISIGGTLRWTHSTDGFIYSSPAVSADGNSIYVCSEDGRLYALAPDGSELWDFEPNGAGVIGSPIFASPVIAADGTVYIAGLRDPNLYAVDPNNGSVKWVCNFASGGWPFASPVVAADGTIYQVLMFDPNLYAIEPNTGTIIWVTDLADPESGWFDSGYINRYRYADSLSEPALGPDGTIYVSLNDPYLRAVDPNGNIKWVTRLGMSEGSTLTVGSDGLVYAADSDGYLCVLDANGSEAARFQSDGGLIFPVVSADNTIIISDANSKVWAVSGDGCPGPAYELHRPEDLDASLSVNFKDFALLALDWLGCTETYLYPWEYEQLPTCDYQGDEVYFRGDIDRNLYVDFADVQAIANRWLSDY